LPSALTAGLRELSRTEEADVHLVQLGEGDQLDEVRALSVRAARQVGSILKHVADTDVIEPRYRYYM
jgi:hypothetical protein